MIALDTSVVIAAVLAWHEEHATARDAADGGAAPAHVVLESYSVLTRLPSPHRVTPTVATELLDGWFPSKRILLPGAALVRSLTARLGNAGVEGGAAYDALIGLTAAEHGAELLTRDARAARTYEALSVPYRLLAG
jgi:predicted nucleic acid-binding protein